VPHRAVHLTALARATGWRYSINVTNIPAAGRIGGGPGSNHAQFIDVLHRVYAVVEDQVNTNKAMGLRPAPSWPAGSGCAPCPHPPDQLPRPRDPEGAQPSVPAGAGAAAPSTSGSTVTYGTRESDTAA
jgi:hypothetical protein